ncbi:MAG: helix-turn-helix domain-containing protein, partial [Planctomycetota bacterium]|nr:helix-turn-helix domain-containing protein [Planctomycetota bacterium]
PGDAPAAREATPVGTGAPASRGSAGLATGGGDEIPCGCASLAEIEKMAILRTLRATGWNRNEAAGILGINKSTLYRKLKQYGLLNGERKGKQ